jgi:hypothetical protein
MRANASQLDINRPCNTRFRINGRILIISTIPMRGATHYIPPPDTNVPPLCMTLKKPILA